MLKHGSSHVGTEWVLSRIRNKFWVVNTWPMLKSIRRCVWFAKDLFQNMLTEKWRICHQNSASHISNVGVDTFGPFNVTKKRSQVKQCGCVFFYFVTRAVHLEILSSIKGIHWSNDFIHFVASCGAPLIIRSDNGTNLVGTCSESARKLPTKIVCHARRQRVDWTINPPHTLHNGGMWEHMRHMI